MTQTLSQSFRTTLRGEQVDVLTEWLQNYNGAANTPAEEMTIQQAFEAAVLMGLGVMNTENAEHSDATVLPIIPIDRKSHPES